MSPLGGNQLQFVIDQRRADVADVLTRVCRSGFLYLVFLLELLPLSLLTIEDFVQDVGCQEERAPLCFPHLRGLYIDIHFLETYPGYTEHKYDHDTKHVMHLWSEQLNKNNAGT